jgi:threonine synthase
VVYCGARWDAPALRALWRQRRESLQANDQSGVWRFRELLPVLRNDASPVTLHEGNTPLYALPACARASGLENLWAKHQGLNPTGSFKDTGMTVAVSQASETGQAWLACASTGNTSASMAAYAARAGMRSLVLVPAGKITWSKLAQALDHGAFVCQLRTDFDGCMRVLHEVVARRSMYLVNSMNPYRLEGQKTAAAELLEQMNWQVPDHVIVPGGNLANASALGKGFLELQHWGFIARSPRISIIQAEGANPLVRSLRDHQGRELVPVVAETRATAIRIGNPASWKKAVRVLTETGGQCIDVSEEEIAAAKRSLGHEGIGCEPASAATLAGARRLAHAGAIAPEESVVLILTGHGLKDPDYTRDTGAAMPEPIDAAASAVFAELERA